MIKVIVWSGHASAAGEFDRHYAQMDTGQLTGR